MCVWSQREDPQPDMPCASCQHIARVRSDERTKIELMLVAEGYEGAAFLVANMAPDGRAGHREEQP